jgi:hypothetical protein
VPGKVTLKYNKGKHEVAVDAIYDADGYQLKYVNSANMNYKLVDGQTQIHPAYNDWVAKLNNTIRAAQIVAAGTAGTN